jgi:D-alanine--poly(phosphoribitol) ligase subunit 1
MIDVTERIERVFALHADRPALNIAGVQCTYGELRQRVLAIQSLLDTGAADSEKLIGVVGADTLDDYAAILAVLRSGRAFVPLNPQHPPQRNQGIAQQAGLRTLLVSSTGAPPWASADSTLRILHTPSASAGHDISNASVAPDDLAYLLFTSGSTATPKGVPITRANLAAFLDALDAGGYSVNLQDRVLQMFDPTFDFSIAAYLAPLSRGACVFMVSSGGAKSAEVYRLLEEERLTVAPLVPSVLSYLRPYFPDISLPHLRLSMFCGEPLYADVVDAWMRCAPASAIANFYGPTEATVFALVYEWRSARRRQKQLNGVVSIGRPMGMNRAIVVDEALVPVASGVRGELCIAGPQLTPGYWGDAELNRRAFFERHEGGETVRYYRTGDLVMGDSDGDFHFCGRLDYQVKLNGYRVELGEIEHHARLITGGRACIALVCGNRTGELELNLVVETDSDAPTEILAELRTRVPAYMVPIRVVPVSHLPMNANGKIDRMTLQRLIQIDLR